MREHPNTKTFYISAISTLHNTRAQNCIHVFTAIPQKKTHASTKLLILTQKKKREIRLLNKVI